MRMLIVVLSFFWAAAALTDAGEITVSDFLATARNDYTLDNQNAKLDFLHTSSSNTPFFDRIEFRTETDGFEFPRQRYSLRFYPNGWGETGSGKKVYKTTVAANETQRALLLHQALKRRYTLVVELLHTRNMVELTQQLMVLYEDRVRVLRQGSESTDFNMNDLVEAEDDYTRIQLELIDLENTRSAIDAAIRACTPDNASVGFDAGSIAEIGSIEKAIRQLNTAIDEDNVYLRDSAARLELAQWSYDLEKSRGRKYISYFETHYDNEERHDAREAIFVELGIRFPFINTNRLDTNRRMLAYLTEKGRYEELKQVLSEKRSALTGDLEKLLKQHALLTAKEERASLKSSLTTYLHLEGVDPLMLLKLKESTLKRDITLEKLRYAIYSQYVEFLDVLGALSEKPLKNYLSSAQELVAP